MEKIRIFIEVNGIVQGVGFRPFIYNLAINNNLKGWVNNTSNGVLIDIEGNKIDIDNFLYNLKHNKPPLANITSINISSKNIKNFKNFKIKSSSVNINNNKTTYISPDYSICNDCRKEIFDKNNRRYRYPFTNCINCGPRFTIIKELPYDRDVTTMSKFSMCSNCKKEYENPLNRRFHAQPNACEKCGPKLSLIDKNGQEIQCNDPINKSLNLIKNNNILAIKSLGGFNLVCDYKSEFAISLLRQRKQRPDKPLAVMMKDITTIKKYCIVSEEEEKTLLSNKRPILLLNKKKDFYLPDNLAPNNKKLGVMLPYTPMHYLLFDNYIDGLVMTSGNISGETMVYNNDEAFAKLINIVDFYLMNNRDIYMPIDDSVNIFINQKERIIRPGRGYYPISYSFNTKEAILALGSDLKNTFALSNKNDVFISQYIGDLKNLNVLNSFEKSLNHFINTYKITPSIIALDMHPDFICKNLDVYKTNREIKKVNIQHHHAHIVSCMAENNEYNNVIGIAFDGTGYGADKKIWGGEFIICNRKNFNRVGHLKYFKLPSGENGIKEPWKIAISLLYDTYKDDYEKYLPTHIKYKNYKIIEKIIDKNINCPETSSMGRLFDGISTLIGFDKTVTFEGEAAIYLENISEKSIDNHYEYTIDEIIDNYILNFNNIIKGIIDDISNSVDKRNIARKFHNTIIKSTVEMSLILRKKFNINTIALSGGVFQNTILFEGIEKELNNNNFKVLTHKNIPCNDSGISFGQLFIANELFS